MKNKKNKKYEEQINKLILAASKEAVSMAKSNGEYREMRSGKGGPRVHYFQTEYFHKAINRMAREAGLRP